MNLLWLQSGGCGGCTLSWLGYEHGPLFQVLAEEGHLLDRGAEGVGGQDLGQRAVPLGGGHRDQRQEVERRLLDPHEREVHVRVGGVGRIEAGPGGRGARGVEPGGHLR